MLNVGVRRNPVWRQPRPAKLDSFLSWSAQSRRTHYDEFNRVWQGSSRNACSDTPRRIRTHHKWDSATYLSQLMAVTRWPSLALILKCKSSGGHKLAENNPKIKSGTKKNLTKSEQIKGNLNKAKQIKGTYRQMTGTHMSTNDAMTKLVRTSAKS